MDERALEETGGLPEEGTGWKRETKSGVNGSPNGRIIDDRTDQFGDLET